jgi:putative hydrolase of the HAD superfamily
MDAVILDVGGVLLVPHFESVGPAFEPFGIALDADRAQRAHFFGVRELDTANEDSAEERRAYLVGYAKAVGVPTDEQEQALELMREAWGQPNLDVWRQPVRGSQDALRQLANAGVKLGVVSNADGTVEEQLRRGQICQVGEGLGVPVLAIIDSGVVGVAKPEADIFRHALGPINIPPERAIYVGDTLRYDVRGARAAGLLPVHFDPYELCPQRSDHAHISQLGEVSQLI